MSPTTCHCCSKKIEGMPVLDGGLYWQMEHWIDYLMNKKKEKPREVPIYPNEGTRALYE